MPAKAKTNEVDIVRAARALLEKHGASGFSMNDVARAVGVRAPSLYNRFADRDALVDAVELELVADLRRTLITAAQPNPEKSLTAQAHAFRAFAKKHPEGYSLISRRDAAQTEAGRTARASAVTPLLPALVALVGEDEALTAARVLVPYMHGFASMELAGIFRMGGGLDAAYANGIRTILNGMKKPSRQTKRKRR